MTSVEDTLDMVRKQVQSFTKPDDDDGTTLLSSGWRFLESKWCISIEWCIGFVVRQKGGVLNLSTSCMWCIGFVVHVYMSCK